jgi:hypothetical protein
VTEPADPYDGTFAYLDNNATTPMSKRSRSSTNSGRVQRMHCVGCGNSIQRASGVED